MATSRPSSMAHAASNQTSEQVAPLPQSQPDRGLHWWRFLSGKWNFSGAPALDHTRSRSDGVLPYALAADFCWHSPVPMVFRISYTGIMSCRINSHSKSTNNDLIVSKFLNYLLYRMNPFSRGLELQQLQSSVCLTVCKSHDRVWEGL